MMSLQTSTHSSQMKTVGPAMSLRTSFWSLLQNEHRRTSDSAVFFIWSSLSRGALRRAPRAPPRLRRSESGSAAVTVASRWGSFLPPAYYLIDDTIVLPLGRIHDEVAVG